MDTTKLRGYLNRAHEAACDFDSADYSPASAAYRLWTKRLRARERQAMEDPAYAAEEQARRTENGTVIVAGENFTVKSFFDHMNRFDELAPPTRVDGLLLDVKNNIRLGKVTGSLLAVFDKVTRGFTDSDVWGMDHVLAAQTGTMLLALADMAHGWPDGRFETFEDWTAALRHNGQLLIDYSKGDGLDDLLDYVHIDDEELHEAGRKAYHAREDELAAGAKKAWQWVADHHESLWD